MSDVSDRLMQHFAETMDDERFFGMFAPDGIARTQQWQCEDGWLVAYTTERIEYGGDNAGKFACMAYKPIGKGARSGSPEHWERVYFRTFSKRKAAKNRALELYRQHSPSWDG